MRPSRKELAAQVADQRARIERLVKERDEHKAQALANVGALRLVGRELSDLKDEVARHIVAEHSSSLALREACEARGINLRIELARLEGSQP